MMNAEVAYYSLVGEETHNNNNNNINNDYGPHYSKPYPSSFLSGANTLQFPHERCNIYTDLLEYVLRTESGCNSLRLRLHQAMVIVELKL
jgi:hypothetical protein